VTDLPADREVAIRQRRAVITPPPWRWGDWSVTFGKPEQQRWHLERSPDHGAFPAPARRRDVDADEILPGLEDPIEYYPELEANAEFIAHAPDDIDWLLDRHEQDRAEVERLRGLLRRLEWAGDVNAEASACPVCGSEKGLQDHRPGCRLAAEIRSA
jgi:hypothetical protein